MRTPLLLGNWKLHGDLEQIEAAVAALAPAVRDEAQLGLCVTALHLDRAVQRAGDRLSFGVQDVSAHVSGAHTGEHTAQMAAELGAGFALIGHSERRVDHGECDAIVAAKLARVLETGMVPVLCIGESESDFIDGASRACVAYQLNKALAPNMSQAGLARLVVAYEPVWAIGTGRSASAGQVADMHQHIRQCLRDILGAQADQIRLLYGGSVKADNAGELLALDDVDGALVGGASLDMQHFLKIYAQI